MSRRYWSELHLDLAGVPELRGERAEVPATGRRLDLPRVAAARRVALERAVARLGDDGARQRRFDEWCAMHPDVHDYAAFRARVEGSGDAGRALHAYVQWSMAEQLTELARRVDARGQSLCLDLPIGVHRAGYDVAEHPELFVAGASIGAPPDLLQPAGQDWGAPPLHPHAQRADGYAYLAACLDEHLRYARALRIDHVMGLHRIWMIPPGASPADGAYVHFAAEEQWAVVCLAAAEHDATVVGENLGTVPAETERALRRHRALGTWVLQFAVPDREDVAVAAPRPGDLACVDTHDLPTFATWWHGLPPGPRGALLQTLRNAGELQTDYGETIAPEDVLTAVLAWIGRSRAPVVLASLEDLWLEPDPQNIPGAAHQDASFRQRCAFGLDELDGLASVTRAIGALARSRPHTVARAPARTA